MEDIDNDNQIEQTNNLTYDASNSKVAQETFVDGNEDHRENNVRRRNYGDWSESEKIRVKQIDMKETNRIYFHAKN